MAKENGFEGMMKETLSDSEEREKEELEEGEIVGDSLSQETEEDDGDGGSQCLRSSHPLEYSWTFWFDNPSGKAKQATWGSSIRLVYTFSTVEDFWGLYNNIRCPSKLAVGADLHCFKDGIQPKWEDPICANGGKWTIACSRGRVDAFWLSTLLAVIGDQFDHGDDICGVVVNVRAKQEKISIWTKNGSDQVAQLSIGRQWKVFLDYTDNINFILHEDAKKHDRHAKGIYQA